MELVRPKPSGFWSWFQKNITVEDDMIVCNTELVDWKQVEKLRDETEIKSIYFHHPIKTQLTEEELEIYESFEFLKISAFNGGFIYSSKNCKVLVLLTFLHQSLPELKFPSLEKLYLYDSSLPSFQLPQFTKLKSPLLLPLELIVEMRKRGVTHLVTDICENQRNTPKLVENLMELAQLEPFTEFRIETGDDNGQLEYACLVSSLVSKLMGVTCTFDCREPDRYSINDRLSILVAELERRGCFKYSG